MNLNVKINDLTNRDQITNETEALFKYLLTVKKCRNYPNPLTVCKTNQIKKITKLYNYAMKNELILAKLDPPIYEVLLKYHAIKGIDAEETYYEKEWIELI